MAIGNVDMRKPSPAKKRFDVTPGEPVRIIRELQGLSQTRLSALCGIIISSIESDRVDLGVERAKVLGAALRCHPAVLVFPGWQLGSAA